MIEASGREDWWVSDPSETKFPARYEFLLHYTGDGVEVVDEGPVGELEPVTDRVVTAARWGAARAWGLFALCVLATIVAVGFLVRAVRGRRRPGRPASPGQA